MQYNEDVWKKKTRDEMLTALTLSVLVTGVRADYPYTRHDDAEIKRDHHFTRAYAPEHDLQLISSSFSDQLYADMEGRASGDIVALDGILFSGSPTSPTIELVLLHNKCRLTVDFLQCSDKTLSNGRVRQSHHIFRLTPVAKRCFFRAKRT